MSVEKLTGGFYKNSVKQDDIASARQVNSLEIRQLGQSKALQRTDRFVVNIPSVFVVGMRMEDAPEDIYEIGEAGSLERVFVENATQSKDGGTDITLTFMR